MDRPWSGFVQHHQCCAGLATGGDALLLALLSYMDLLRLAANRAAVEVDKYHFRSFVCLRDWAVCPFGHGLETLT